MTTQDPELSAALGWPGGISDPVLDRKVLLQKVAALMQDKLWEDHRVRHLWDHTLAQQAEPLNLADPAVRKRLASQWGYVPATAQAEPVEPVAWLAPRTVDSYSRPDLGYETCSKSDYGAFPVYTAPPQRTIAPLTEEEIKTAFHAARNAKLGASQDNSRHRLSVIEIARAVEQALWEKHHG